MGYSFCYYISGKWKVGDLQSAITANFAKSTERMCPQCAPTVLNLRQYSKISSILFAGNEKIYTFADVN